jgi:hypothetical protein
LAGRKIVEANHRFAVAQKTVNKVAANKTCRACDKNLIHARKAV